MNSGDTTWKKMKSYTRALTYQNPQIQGFNEMSITLEKLQPTTILRFNQMLMNKEEKSNSVHSMSKLNHSVDYHPLESKNH